MQDVFDSDVIMEIKDEETWEQKVDNAPVASWSSSS